MKTLEEVKDKVAKDYGYINWLHFSTDSYGYQDNVLKYFDDVSKEYAKQCLQQAVERITEKTKEEILKRGNSGIIVGLNSSCTIINQLLKELE